MAQAALTQEETEKIKSETLSVAEAWVSAWNGKIDAEKMMALYHPEMKYVWRGVSPPGNFQGFRQFVEETLVPEANYALTMSEVDITVLDRGNAIVFFHFKDRNEDPYGSGAATLVMTKQDKDWKIRYVHESSIEGS